MVRLWILATDFYHGFADAICGVRFIVKILKAEREVLDYEPPQSEPVEMTVARLRRVARGTRQFAREEGKKKDEFKVCLLKIFLVNLVSLLLWQLLAFLLQSFFTYMGHEFYGTLAGLLVAAPILSISKIAQVFWCSDISGASMRALGVKPPLDPMPFDNGFAQTMISAIHGGIFMAQASLSQYLPIPIITKGIVFAHMALVNSMYSFDYFFEHYNLTFKRRMEILEQHWPYFLGFGTPLNILCYLHSNMLVNSIIFSFFFPLMIISSYKSNFNRSYEEKVPEIQYCRISYMFTQVVARVIRHFFPHLFGGHSFNYPQRNQ